MSKLRSQREHQVLAFLHNHPEASALEIGNAAVKGEARARKMTMHAKEAIGLAIACRLVKCGRATVTKGNQFRLD